jgi:hypothetical protein
MQALRVGLRTAALLVAGCVAEPTGVEVVPAYVSWLEWPTAVTATQPGALRVSGWAQCPYRVVFSASVSGTEIRLSAEGRDPGNWACVGPNVAGGGVGIGVGSGAGFDTLLPLPRLSATPSGQSWFQIWAPMEGPGYWHAGDQLVGGINLGAIADTATQFAGRATVFTDSSGCWRMRPWSRSPAPQWVFTKPVPLAPRTYAYYGYVSGRFVAANPPICGEPIAVQATRLEVDVTPWGASLSRSR